MANRFMCSCGDHFDTSLLLAKYDALIGFGGGAVTVAGGGRNGNCIHLAVGSLSIYLRKNLSASYSRLIAGVAFKVSALPLIGSVTVFDFADTGAFQGGAWIDAAGRIGFGYSADGNGTDYGTHSVGQSTSGMIQPNQWYYLEIDYTPHTTNGAVTLWLNNVQQLTTSAVRTSYNAATVNQFAYHSTSPFNDYYYDDCYINDATGARNNSRWQDTKIVPIFATAAGAVSGWTAVGAGTNWQCVSDTTPDGDTSYVNASAATTQDLYQFADLDPSINTVRAVQAIGYARKDDTTPRQYALTIADSAGASVTVVGGLNFALSQTYTFHLAPADTYPVDATGWTPAKVNAMTGGPQVIS